VTAMQDLAWLSPASPHPRNRAKVFARFFQKALLSAYSFPGTP
jgi:hypothetical protein